MPDKPDASAARAPFIPKRFWLWMAGALLIVVVDQLTKSYFSSLLNYAERLPVFPFFDFTLLYNPGAAFSFLAAEQGWQRWLFTLIAVGAIGLILHLLRRHPRQTLFCVSLTCVLGGATGNLIDRIQHGHVVDFLLFYWKDWYFPAFNVADIAISCGAALLILDEILRMRRERRRRAGSAA
ncbi:MAG TPA: signal peptidase II [Pusillimonas sp.]|uniref:signal peptidase II n=1 Tax=Pusillimonas sp. TaxID=3040095 RepID=UPI002D0F9B75|nr:signal peptidase II [Pusillimonas sp.]HUH86848.1 signal peptidase II [Pusillimonas sp.]